MQDERQIGQGNSAFEKDTIEGDDAYDLEMKDYPLDSLLIRTENRTVHDVYRRICQGQYIMDPDFQRDFVWQAPKQSRLIESMLMRIPLPVFYLAERSDGKIIVIDGLQRLTTIQRYLENRFSLRKLENGNDALMGKKFDELSVKLQNRLEDTTLILYLLDEKVPDKAKFDIFQRVNEGTPLSRQQMRNCIYSGVATLFLKELAQEEDFLNATARGISARSMRDREVINRFLAFQILGLQAYNGDMDLFLAETLKVINHDPEMLKTHDLRAKFVRSLRNNAAIWGDHAFRKHAAGQTGRNVINIALFDVLAYVFAFVPEDAARSFAPQLRGNLLQLFEDSAFLDAITFSTNDARRVAARFALIHQIFPAELSCYIP